MTKCAWTLSGFGSSYHSYNRDITTTEIDLYVGPSLPVTNEPVVMWHHYRFMVWEESIIVAYDLIVIAVIIAGRWLELALMPSSIITIG